jgi:hypothetical protein
MGPVLMGMVLGRACRRLAVRWSCDRLTWSCH